MSPSGPSSSTVSGSRVLRSSNAVASGSGSSPNPSSSKKRCIQSDSFSLAPEEPQPKRIVVLRVPKLPIPTPLPERPSSPVASPSRSPLPLLRATEFQDPAARSQLPVGGKQLLPPFGNNFLVIPYPGHWGRRSDTVSVGDPSADTTRRFRLHASEGFLYPKSSVPTQDFPSVDMCLRRMEMSRIRLQGLTREDGPFSKAEYLSLPPAPVDIPVWVDPVVDYDTGYMDVVGLVPVAPCSPSTSALLSRDGPDLQNEFRLLLASLVASLSRSPFLVALLKKNAPVSRRLSPKTQKKRARDILAIRNSIQDVLSETRNAAIASAEYRVALRREFDCAGTRAHAHQLYQELTRALQFLVENGDLSGFEDPYLDFTNTLLLQRLQAKDPSCGYRFRRFDCSEYRPPMFIYPNYAPCESLPVYPVRVPSSPPIGLSLSDIHMEVDDDEPSPAQNPYDRVPPAGHGSGKVSASYFDPAKGETADMDGDGHRRRPKPSPWYQSLRQLRDSKDSEDDSDVEEIPPPSARAAEKKRAVDVPGSPDVVMVSDDDKKGYWRGAHFVVESCLDPSQSRHSSIAFILVLVFPRRRICPLPLSPFRWRITAIVASRTVFLAPIPSLVYLAPAAPVFGTKSNPTPLPGDITATPPDQVPVPTLLGLPLRGLKKGVYRGDVWESNLVPAPQLPAELPSFLGGSHPYRRTPIVEDAEPSYRWPDMSYRPPIHDDDLTVPEDALAIDVRADSIVGKLEYGRVAEFEKLDGDVLVDSFVQLVCRGQHAVTVMTRAIVYALGPRLLRKLNHRGTDVDVPRLEATLDGVPLPFPTPLSSISSDLALHAHLSRMAGAEHPFLVFVRAALESDTMRGYATGKGLLERSELVEWEQFAESSLFKHFFLKQSKKAPNKPFIPLWSPSNTLQVATQQASKFGSSKDGAAVDFGVLGRGMDVSGSLSKPPEWAKELERQHKIVDTAEGKASPPFAESHMRKLRSAIEETVAPARLFSPARRASVAIVEGGSLPDGYCPEPPKNVEPDDEQSMDQSSGERPRDQSMDFSVGERHELVVDGIAVLPGASESKDDVEADVPMEVIEPEDDELNGD
ncbi:hypothetical protein C8F01DRAFT_1254280 [Mycena amicta]|nr:hypothetical protein C8F01DRAFT_1254280 [Mycena amicta]